MEVFKKYLEEKAQVTNEQFRHLEKLAGEKKIAKGFLQFNKHKKI